VEISDHFLLHWKLSTTQCTAIHSRLWRQLDVEEFQSALTTSQLCQPEAWSFAIDEMAAMCDDELNV